MDREIHNDAAWPFPRYANHIQNDITPKDQAIYVPSVSPSHAQMIYDGIINATYWGRALPKGVTAADLNFLDPVNKLFRISHVMTSAGQAMKQKKPCIITQRDRENTSVICDSGGYQIASDTFPIRDDRDRKKVLDWIEANADISMTLDVPTGPVVKNPTKYRFKSTEACLSATMEHLRYFHRNRTPEKVRFLNVLQGNTPAEADVWYKTVKQYKFEGWAFAGILRHNFYELCRRLLIMWHDGELEHTTHIHVLGTNELDTAVLLTALQRTLKKRMGYDIRISYDTSTPWRNLRGNQMFTLPTFAPNKMTMGALQVPENELFKGSPLPWPWPSPIGNKMVMGDYCVTGSLTSNFFRDRLSEVLLAHHNLGALCWAIATANRFFDIATIDNKFQYGRPEGSAVEVIDEIFKSGQMATLERYKNTTFDRLRHSQTFDDGDSGRYWDELR